jgi:hypothetical protein
MTGGVDRGGTPGFGAVGWGAVLNVAGEVTDHADVLERCGGAAGATVLRECREMLERLFPGGEER